MGTGAGNQYGDMIRQASQPTGRIPVYQSDDLKPRGRPMDLAGITAARWDRNGRPALNGGAPMQTPPVKAPAPPRNVTPRTTAPQPGAALAGPRTFNKI